MPSNLEIKRAPFLVLGNFIRNLKLQKGKDLKGMRMMMFQLSGFYSRVPGSLFFVGNFHKERACADVERRLRLMEPTGPRSEASASQGLGFRV